MDILQGSTEVRFGVFLAMISGNVAASDEGANNWKVWTDVDPSHPLKLVERLTRLEAVELAQSLAKDWREAGRPKETDQMPGVSSLREKLASRGA